MHRDALFCLLASCMLAYLAIVVGHGLRDAPSLDHGPVRPSGKIGMRPTRHDDVWAARGVTELLIVAAK